jgi:uncharacterized protein YjaZ
MLDGCRPGRVGGVVAIALASAVPLALLACERHDVEIELPKSGRRLSRTEQAELQRVADAAFRDARSHLDGLPPRITLIVRWGKDVIPETGEGGAAAYPGNIGWTVDADRDVLAIIRTQLRPTLFHELHHLARASRVQTISLRDHVVTEGLATAFERDFAGVAVPWGAPPDDAMGWTREILKQADGARRDEWMIRHPDGRRWIGMRVGTFLVDRASRASGKSSAALVFAPAAEIVRLADVK